MMTQPETPKIQQIALFHILLSVICGTAGVMFGGTIAALRNGVSHVTEACGIGIAGRGASQHWASWSVAVAVLFYAGMINGLIQESIHRPPAAPTQNSNLSTVPIDGVRWARRHLNAAQASPRFKRWLALSLLLGVSGSIASAAIGGAVGGYLYGNFITGLGAAHGVPAIGWLFGIAFGLGAAALSAMLFGSIAGVISGVMLRQLPRSSRRF